MYRGELDVGRLVKLDLFLDTVNDFQVLGSRHLHDVLKSMRPSNNKNVFSRVTLFFTLLTLLTLFYSLYMIFRNHYDAFQTRNCPAINSGSFLLIHFRYSLT